uniref:Sodium channel and clathrin linker 1 n=1 Tax=Stegastes partitus TaxID=144197 RepID=A0A3B4YUT9_9TELE
MAPLIAEYDRHMDEMTEQLQRHQVKKTTKIIRLHAELRESVEKQLHSLPMASGMKGSTLEEDSVIKNLQEQVQLSEQVCICPFDVSKPFWGCVFGIMPHKWQSCLYGHTQNNHHFLKTVTEQSTTMEELHSQLRQAKAELRTATAKVDEMTKLLQNVQGQMQRREEDIAEAQGREDAAERQLQQLQAALSQLETRLKAQTVWERKVGELQACCTTLEEEKYEALSKVRESVQVAEEAALQKDQALLREKQKTEELEKTKEAIKQLIQDAAVRSRKEVENVRKQCNVQIHRMAEELSALQLECADKESQIERSLRERKAVEEELEKVYKEGRAEPEFRKIDALYQKCLNAERLKEDLSLTLQSTQNNLKKMELNYNEELSRCQEELRRLQSCLAAAQDNCVGVSDERLQLQQDNLQLRREMDELRKASLLVQKKAKQQMEHENSQKEQGLDAWVRELEESSRSSSADLTRLLTAQQKSTQRWKEEAKNLVQAFETKITGQNQQKHRSHELETQLETDHGTISEYERQLAEYEEKTSRLPRRLTQAEQRAATASQQLSMLASQRRKTAMASPDSL